MSNPVGELTIEPDPLPEKLLNDYRQILDAELVNVAPNTSVTTLRLADVAMVHLYADYGNRPNETTYGFKTNLCSDLSSKFSTLKLGERTNLEWEVKHSMARQSELLNSDPENYEEYFHESRVFMGHQPLFFEPFDYSMLKGSWGGVRQEQLSFKAVDVPSQAQRLILLGGFATFLTILEQ